MEESDEITLKIRNPNNEDVLNLTVPKSTFISEVKQTICDRLPSNPLPNTQKLIYRGRLCKDESTVKDILPSDFIDKEIFMHIIIPQPLSVKPIVPQQQQQTPPIPSPKPNETLSPTQSISSTVPNPPSSVQSPLDPPPATTPTVQQQQQQSQESQSPTTLTMNSYSSTPTTPYAASPSPLTPEQIDYMNQAITYYQQYLTQYQNYISSLSNSNQTLHNQQQRNSPVDEIHILQQEQDRQMQQQQQEQQARIHRIKLVFDFKMIIQLIIFGCIFGQGYERKGKIVITILCLFLYLIKTGMIDPMKFVINSDRGTIRQDDSNYYDYIIPFLSFFLSLYPGWNPEPIPLPDNGNGNNEQPLQQNNNNNNNQQQQPQQQINENNEIEQQQQQQQPQLINNNENNSQPPVSLHNDNDNNQTQQIINDKKEK